MSGDDKDLFVVRGELCRFGCDTLKDSIDERVHDGHSLLEVFVKYGGEYSYYLSCFSTGPQLILLRTEDHTDPRLGLSVQRKLHQLLCREFRSSQLVLF